MQRGRKFAWGTPASASPLLPLFQEAIDGMAIGDVRRVNVHVLDHVALDVVKVTRAELRVQAIRAITIRELKRARSGIVSKVVPPAVASRAATLCLHEQQIEIHVQVQRRRLVVVQRARGRACRFC